MNKLTRSFLTFALVIVGSAGWAADSGFLSDYSVLEGRKGDVVSRVYIAPGAVDALAGFNSVMVDQPEVHMSPDSKYKGAKPDNLKLLADSLRMGVTQEFESGGYLTSDTPGAETVFMRWAVTDLYLKKKKRGLLSYTPAGFVIHATTQAAIRDVWKKIDIVELTIEAEFIDSVTGDLLGAVVLDRGARKDKDKGQKQELVSWEDLDATMATFGKRLTCRLTNARKFEDDREDCAAIVVEIEKG